MAIMLKLCVYDRPGVLDRITGIIRRNGLNISGINAGEVDQGVSKINILLREYGIEINNLGKHLSELDCVQSWEECAPDSHFIRELLLIKMDQKNYSRELLEDARITEQDGELLYLEYTGLPGEIDSLLEKLRGSIIDCARAGILSLAREGGNG